MSSVIVTGTEVVLTGRIEYVAVGVAVIVAFTFEDEAELDNELLDGDRDDVTDGMPLPTPTQ